MSWFKPLKILIQLQYNRSLSLPPPPIRHARKSYTSESCQRSWALITSRFDQTFRAIQFVLFFGGSDRIQINLYFIYTETMGYVMSIVMVLLPIYNFPMTAGRVKMFDWLASHSFGVLNQNNDEGIHQGWCQIGQCWKQTVYSEKGLIAHKETNRKKSSVSTMRTKTYLDIILFGQRRWRQGWAMTSFVSALASSWSFSYFTFREDK